jgi:hypothetical protein
LIRSAGTLHRPADSGYNSRLSPSPPAGGIVAIADDRCARAH